MNIEAIEMAAGHSQPVLYEYFLNKIEQLSVSKTAELLDVGCGHGNLLTMLAKAGYSGLTGCDVLEKPEDFPKGARFVRHNLNEGLGVGANAYDVVSSIEVIEHLENPRAHVRQLYQACRAGGWVILSTPNTLSLLSKLSLVLRGYFNYFDDSNYPAHIFPVLPIDLMRMFTEIRFKPGFPICWPQMAPLYTREPPSARNSVRRTIVQLQRPSFESAPTFD